MGPGGGGRLEGVPLHHSVVIVGAGLAGLYAARLLRPAFSDLLVVEASPSPGGRIKQVRLRQSS